MKVNIHEAKTNLSKLIQKALEGEEIIISRRQKPLVRLEVLPEAKPSLRFGGLKDLVISMSDDFDEELEDFVEYAPPSLSHVAEVRANYTYGKKGPRHSDK